MISKLPSPSAVRRSLSLPSQWALERIVKRRSIRPGSARYLIIPADPWTLTGSKGDEAMLWSVISQARQERPDAAIAVVTCTAAADQAAQRLGLIPLRAWADRWRLSRVMDAIEEFAPSAAFFLGADIMDGYYGVATSLRPLLIADCAARAGVQCTFLGFSFNSSPRRALRLVYDQLHPSIVLNLRDRTSLERFRAFTTAKAQLVADCAFLLAPDLTSTMAREVKHWADTQRASGKVILGLNVHPMLLRQEAPQQVVQFVAQVVEQTKTFLSNHPNVALLLLGHDDRPGTADTHCLAPIAAALKPVLGDALYYSGLTPHAGEAKACIAVADGVVTGRMHLAIAALGSAVPVMALTYQDKFHGLFEHFGLSPRYLLTPEQVAGSQGLAEVMTQFLRELPQLTTQVAAALPHVRALALRNVAPCVAAGREHSGVSSSAGVHVPS